MPVNFNPDIRTPPPLERTLGNVEHATPFEPPSFQLQLESDFKNIHRCFDSFLLVTRCSTTIMTIAELTKGQNELRMVRRKIAECFPFQTITLHFWNAPNDESRFYYPLVMVLEGPL